MPKKEIQILIQGEDAEAVAREMAGLIRETLGHETQPRALQPGEAGRDVKIDSGTIGAITGIAALVMSIPSTMLTVMDIKERLERKKQADKLIRDAQNIQEQHPSTIIRVRGGKDGTVRIETIDGNTLIDIAKRSAS